MKFLHLHSYDLKKHSVDLKPNKHQPAQTSMHVSKENSVNWWKWKPMNECWTLRITSIVPECEMSKFSLLQLIPPVCEAQRAQRDNTGLTFMILQVRWTNTKPTDSHNPTSLGVMMKTIKYEPKGNSSFPQECADDRVHAGVNCLAGLTPVSGVLYSGHQPPMFSPSIGVVLSEVLRGSWKGACPSNSKSSCRPDKGSQSRTVTGYNTCCKDELTEVWSSSEPDALMHLSVVMSVDLDVYVHKNEKADSLN